MSPNFVSRPFCSHVAMLQDGASLGAYFVNKLALPLVALPLVDFVNKLALQLECNKVEIALRVVQFWSEIKLVITNRTPASRSCDFVITRLISDQIALHSVQLPLLITWRAKLLKYDWLMRRAFCLISGQKLLDLDYLRRLITIRIL